MTRDHRLTLYGEHALALMTVDSVISPTPDYQIATRLALNYSLRHDVGLWLEQHVPAGEWGYEIEWLKTISLHLDFCHVEQAVLFKMTFL